MHNLSDSIERKFVDSILLDDEWEIETDTGWQPISHIHKTIKYQEWRLVLENGHELICADDHIVFTENLKEVFVKDLSIGDFVLTDVGKSSVVSIEPLNKSSNMFDITVDSEDHRFYANGILSHNTTTAVAIILHYILFNEYKTVAILANKGDSAREVLSRIKLAYEALPKWLQQGIVEWNKGSIELENGCKVLAGTTTSSAIRGKAISFLYLDEVAFIDGYDDFFASVYPTLSSGEETKLLMTSTPNGLNHFFKTCEGAEKGTNGYQFVRVVWDDVPGRGEEWKNETLAAIDFDMDKFNQEYNCQFLGSSGTLINGAKLKTLFSKEPVVKTEQLSQYEQPKKGNSYVCIVDVSRGKGLDYSTFSIIDVTEMPYRQVCTFRDNLVGPMDFTSVIFRFATLYNEASVLVEINDNGQQIADMLLYDYGYENMLFTENAGRSGKRISAGFGKNVDRGIRTTKSVKAIGCAIVKMLIEQEQLIIHDHHTIEEFKTFSRRANSFEAESGKHDDMAMTLVLFAWLTDQPFFKEITDINTMSKLREKTEEEIQQELLPFGFIDDGSGDAYDKPNEQVLDWNVF
jgi:hypothetical protein